MAQRSSQIDERLRIILPLLSVVTHAVQSRMPYIKTIVCLAHSYKNQGRCVAGREVLERGYGGWIRPVSARDKSELKVYECSYSNGLPTLLLDVFRVHLLKPVCVPPQWENHLISGKQKWIKLGKLRWDQLGGLCEAPDTLWTNRDSTSSGHFDCLSGREALSLVNSLLLIHANEVVVVAQRRTPGGRRTYRCQFDYNSIRYDLAVTDPAIFRSCEVLGDGRYKMNSVYLCISLTAPYVGDGRCHKIVATILTNPLL